MVKPAWPPYEVRSATAPGRVGVLGGLRDVGEAGQVEQDVGFSGEDVAVHALAVVEVLEVDAAGMIPDRLRDDEVGPAHAAVRGGGPQEITDARTADD